MNKKNRKSTEAESFQQNAEEQLQDSKVFNNTKPNQVKLRLMLNNDILNFLNQPKDFRKIIENVILVLKKFTTFDVVAIRLKEGEDYPYYVHNTFPNHFVEKENYLCQRDLQGQIVRDEIGNPVLECMCGNIICGRTNSSKDFFTKGGSFWTNSTTKLLASTSEKDRQARTRNRCNGEGYESVALMPIRSENKIIGLLQMNDKRTDCFTKELIEFFESITNCIGIALTRKKLQEDNIKMQESLESLSFHLERIRENERSNIAKEIHDSIAQPLTAIKMDINWLYNRVDITSVESTKLSEMNNLATNLINDVQLLYTDLRPPMLKELGLNSTIEWYIREFEKRTGLNCQLELNDVQLPNEKRNITLFRCLQEALKNVEQHARAKKVNINIYLHENSIVMEIIDNGIGFVTEKIDYSKSSGLTGMRERLKKVNGQMDISSTLNKGTKLQFVIPIN